MWNFCRILKLGFYHLRSMRWSTTLTWLVLSYIYPYQSFNLVNAKGGSPPSQPNGSKAFQGSPGQQPNAGAQGGPPPRLMRDRATELLLLRPLNDGKVATHFEFEYLTLNAVPRDPRTLGREDEDQHYEFFPLSMGQILREYAVAELHLTLNTGRWRYDAWGLPENPAVASGAELWAWMADGGPISTEDRWKGLTNALAGLFCASLSSLAESRTTSPRHSFYPEGQLPLYSAKPGSTDGSNPPAHGYSLYHAVLPSEAICTENLTPFTKLLPCKSYTGVAELLNPHKLFGGWWYGMGIHATWHDGETESHHHSVEDKIDPATLGLSDKARAGKYKESDKEMKGKAKTVKRSAVLPTKQERGIKLKLTVGAVRDPMEGLSPEKVAMGDWSLETLFGKNITKLCPVTSKADVRILSPPNADPVEPNDGKERINPPNLRVAPLPVAVYRSREYAMDREMEWDVVRVGNRGLNLTISHKNMAHDLDPSSPLAPLTLTRSLRGSDQTRGGLSVAITNHMDFGVDAWYVESVPWIIRPYLSTLGVEAVEQLPVVSGSPGQVAQQAFFSSSNSTPILNLQNIHYAPPSASKDEDSRTKPTLLEIPLHLPPRSVIHITLEFEKVFLKYTEHPPDAQRGWEIPGGVLIPSPFTKTESGHEGVVGRLPRMYTAPLLADLATPDFSMPYNVIILSGALVALLFGMLFNMLTRRFVLVKS